MPNLALKKVDLDLYNCYELIIAFLVGLKVWNCACKVVGVHLKVLNPSLHPS